ncbi:hypothetical protein ACFL67_01105 [candidate division KSB1 bacterium]
MIRSKKYIFILLIMTVLFLVNGCIVNSINPFYTEDTLIYLPELNGKWSTGDDSETETLTFYHQKEKSYKMIHEDEKKRESVFEAHLFEMDGQYFLDSFPEEIEDVSEFMYIHLAPMHTLFRISFQNQSAGLFFTTRKLVLEPINYEWFDEQIKNGALSLEYVKQDEDSFVVLTAPTEDIQKFILEHINVAFDESEAAKFTRVH